MAKKQMYTRYVWFISGGCLEVSFPSTLNRELIGEVLGFGDQVEVLEPAELRREIAAIAGRTARIYS